MAMVWAVPRPESEMAAKRDRSPPEPEYREIGRRLRAAREAQHRTQLEMGLELNISESTYGRREAGEIRFPLPDLIRVAHILGVAFEDLMPGSPEPPPQPSRPAITLLRELTAAIEAGEPIHPQLRGMIARLNRLPPNRVDEVARRITEQLDEDERTDVPAT